MTTTAQTKPTAKTSASERKPLEALWIVNAPVSLHIAQKRAWKLTETYEATRDGGAADHQRVLGLRIWPRYRGHLTHLPKQLAC